MDNISELPSESEPNRPHRKLKRFVRLLVRSILILLSVVLITWFWYFHRSQPSSQRIDIFEGVTYIRDVRTTPVANVCHILLIKLDSPGLRFLVTPGDSSKPRPLVASLTSEFLKKFKLQAAINGDFFFPWHSTAPWDYYPHIGDRIELEGIAASNGNLYSLGGKRINYPSIFISQQNEATFVPVAEDAYNVISGDHIFLKNGKFGRAPSQYHTSRQPRTCVALNADRTTMIWIVVDGRQPNYSEGMTMQEIAQVITTYGGTDALNLDGGGSSEMVFEGKDHQVEVVNCPIDCHIPGRERPVANQLGLFALPIKSVPK